MLSNFKAKIESKLGSQVSNAELLNAIEMAKKDVVSNDLVMGKNVTAEYFESITACCVKISRGTDKPISISQPSQICPECGYRLQHEGGCSFCPNCGWSQCK